MNCVDPDLWPSLSPDKVGKVSLRVLPAQRSSFHCPSGPPLRGAVVLLLVLVDGTETSANQT